MILVDSNIPMYLVGAEHPLKADAQRLLERSVTLRERLVTDAEVLQEILHRYVAIDRRDAIQPAFDALLGAMDEVFPVDLRRAGFEVMRQRGSHIVMTKAGFAATLSVPDHHELKPGTLGLGSSGRASAAPVRTSASQPLRMCVLVSAWG